MELRSNYSATLPSQSSGMPQQVQVKVIQVAAQIQKQTTAGLLDSTIGKLGRAFDAFS